MKFVSPYILQAYLTCPREAWFEYHSIRSDQEHELLSLGKLIHEISYQRARKEIFVDQLLKIDLLRGELVAEVKKSSKQEEAARLQLAYYLFYLKREKGIEMDGVLLFPKERKTERVPLTLELETRIERLLNEMEPVLASNRPPAPARIRYCKSCSFEELCWA